MGVLAFRLQYKRVWLKSGGKEKKMKGDVKRVTVTLPNGAVQVFEINAQGRVYPLGSTLYWTVDQFNVALAKMRAAGAEVEID